MKWKDSLSEVGLWSWGGNWIEAWEKSFGYGSIEEESLKEYFGEKYSEEQLTKLDQLSDLNNFDSVFLSNWFRDHYGNNYDGYI